MITTLAPGYKVWWLNPETNQDVPATVKTVYKTKVKLILSDLSTETANLQDVELASLRKTPKPLGFFPFYEDYLKVKADYPDALILDQNEGMLEAYGDDADRLAEELDLVKGTKAISEDGLRVSVSGFPATSKKYILELWTKQIKFQVFKENGEIISISEIQPFPIGSRVFSTGRGTGTVIDFNNVSCRVQWDDFEWEFEWMIKDAIEAVPTPKSDFQGWLNESINEFMEEEGEFDLIVPPISPDKPESSTDEADEIQHLDIDEIRIDGGTQQRVKFDLNHVKNLVAQLEEGHDLEPIVVFFDGTNYWLADGFHRIKATENYAEDQYNGQAMIACSVHQGDQRAAILYSVGANSDHKPCLPRTNADKRHAVECLLNDPEWSQWSDREIARNCKVSDRFVNSVRKSICEYSHIEKPTEKIVKRNGTEYKMKVADNDDNDDLRPMAHETEQPQTTGSTAKVTPIKILTDEILLGFLSNIEYLNREQLEAAEKAIAKRLHQLNEQEQKCHQIDLSQKAS